jgi:methylmalonyl-CoA mutase
VAEGRRLPTFDQLPIFTDSFPRQGLAEWEAAASRSLGPRSLRSLSVEPHDGLRLKPLYTKHDTGGEMMPGVTRAESTWEACCPIDLRAPEAAIQETMAAVARGARSFWLSVDRRSSSWARLSASAVVEVLEATGGAPVYLDARAVSPALAALLAAAARRRGASLADLQGGFDFDPLGSLAGDGNLQWNLEACFELMTEMVRWTEAHATNLRAVAVSTMPYAKAGAGAVQELAIALATAAEYLRRAEHGGVPPDVLCRRLRLIMPVGRDLFTEICKLRAVRMVWARLAEACGLLEIDRRLPVHAITSPTCLTTRDPWTNLLRSTTHCYAAVIGGADVVTVLPFDSALGRPDDLARRLALNTHNILREESRLDQVDDPAHGSYLFERLSHDLASAAWERFQRIEAAGGMAVHLRTGAIARELGETLSRKRRAIATRRDLITGVSSYPDLAEPRLCRQRESRGARPLPDEQSTAVRRALGSSIASFDEAVDAASQGVSARNLLELFPGHDEPEQMTALPCDRDAAPFERLRDASDRQLERTGTRPHVFLAAVGPASDHRRATGEVTRVLAAGGISTIRGEALEEVADAATAFEASGSSSAVICGSADLVGTVARELKARGALRVLAAGPPGDHEEAWRGAGVDGFIHEGTDILILLADLHEIEGVRRD